MKLKKGIKPEKIRNDEGKIIHQQKSKPKISMYVTANSYAYIQFIYISVKKFKTNGVKMKSHK